jgi:Protein of unknown function (DUF2997)
MAEYQRIEYRIDRDGKVVETVLGGTGESCVNATEGIEAALGAIADREYLPEYYATEAVLATATVQQSQAPS